MNGEPGCGKGQRVRFWKAIYVVSWIMDRGDHLSLENRDFNEGELS